MNTKQTALLFFDLAVAGEESAQHQNELGRIYIVPGHLSAARNFTQIFESVEKGFVERGQTGTNLAKLVEAKRNAFAKFSFDTDTVNRLTEGQVVNEMGRLSTENEPAHPSPSTPFSAEPNGLVVMNWNSNPSFYVLTSSWSAQTTRGDIVGTIYKGMELIQHVSWFGSENADQKVNENCFITAMGLIQPGGDLGIKQRDSLLDPFPDTPSDADLDHRDFEKILNVSFKIKASGSLLFRQERYQMARFRFGKAVRYLGWATERQKITLEQELRALHIIVPCILNSAACRLKLRDYDGALEDCNEAMELCPSSPKAYFRRGQAYHGMMNYEQSLCDLYTALKLSPDDRAIRNEIAAVEGEMRVYKKGPSRRNSEETAMQVQ